ncbi:hypothetical protein [Spartinivicinus ruber]|uniref:hypothetical protein n=1 Tax=Spartinivicinus ruber TaxID=2683272 RepID=UPI0013D5E5BB|nr:hypothetical protein [Spartinivicinus ruber]
MDLSLLPTYPVEELERINYFEYSPSQLISFLGIIKCSYEREVIYNALALKGVQIDRDVFFRMNNIDN